jgi:hypothetical protein
MGGQIVEHHINAVEVHHRGRTPTVAEGRSKRGSNGAFAGRNRPADD